MKTPSSHRPPQYRLSSRRRPDLVPQPHQFSSAWQYVGAAFGLIFLLLVGGGLIWIVASGTGTNRWITPGGLPSSAPKSGQPANSATPKPTPTPNGNKTGTISGKIGFPASTAPAQKICAESISDTSVTYCVQHPAGNDLSYSMTVPVGTYQVYASLLAPQGDYTTTYRAYYNQYVQCQTAGNCAAGLHHQYVAVPVTADVEISDVNPTDWYAQ